MADFLSLTITFLFPFSYKIATPLFLFSSLISPAFIHNGYSSFLFILNGTLMTIAGKNKDVEFVFKEPKDRKVKRKNMEEKKKIETSVIEVTVVKVSSFTYLLFYSSTNKFLTNHI